jgi:hypothetical protein
MKKLPPRPFTQLSTTQRDRLSAWLREWEVELKLHKVDSDTSFDQLPEGGMSGTPLEWPVNVGEIRLLAPHLLSPGQRPVYILVISKWENDWKLVTPFSQFPWPATHGELLTQRSEGPWQVLQVWNSRTLPNEVIAESWVADTASESLLDEAWAVFKHVTFGAELPDKLASRIGPPVLHPSDPRLDYQRMETALLSGLSNEAFKAAEKLNLPLTPTASAEMVLPADVTTAQAYTPASASHLGLAASSEFPLSVVEKLQLGKAARIKLVEQPGEPGIYRVRVLVDPLSELTGAEIISPVSGDPLAKLGTNMASAKFSGKDGILVRLADGRLLGLCKISD